MEYVLIAGLILWLWYLSRQGQAQTFVFRNKGNPIADVPEAIIEDIRRRLSSDVVDCSAACETRREATQRDNHDRAPRERTG